MKKHFYFHRKVNLSKLISLSFLPLFQMKQKINRIIHHQIHHMKVTIVVQDCSLQLKQHRLLPQLIHDNRLVVQQNQVTETMSDCYSITFDDL